MNAQQTLSVVVPCFNEEESLPLFLKELSSVAKKMEGEHSLAFEVILVDDGSTDRTLDVMKEQASAHDSLAIKWVSFSRNFGKEAGLLAGLQHATGDYVATMDADMQDPPSLLPQMFEILQTEDYDNVATRRTTRQGEPPIRSFFARMFYRLVNRISKTEIVDGARDFRLMRRSMVDAILSMPEYNRFSKGIFGWVGFKTKWLPYVNVNRVAGETKWSFFSLLLYSIDGAHASHLHRVGIDDDAQLHAAGGVAAARYDDLGVVAGAVAEKLHILCRYTTGAVGLGCCGLDGTVANFFFIVIDNKKDLREKIEAGRCFIQISHFIFLLFTAMIIPALF